jgi:glutamyl-tRNA synthetase
VGAARAAVFNWLFARKHGGSFILRVEDHDVEPSSRDTIQHLIEALMWLDMKPDEGPFVQSTYIEQHRKAALHLLASGLAYRCFCTEEALEQRRRVAESEHRPWHYNRACRSLTAKEHEDFLREGKPFTVRFLVPPGRTSFEDFVHGVTKANNDEIEDFVLLRPDGRPTYHLSVVSDDIQMRITHIIRGDDQISSTPKQILLYKAFGAEPPIFAHLPLILGPDKKRLSKKHAPISLLDYRDMGILPEAMVNFLGLLGWAPGDDRQMMSREEMASLFSFEGIAKAGAIFDLDKLLWLNGQYIRLLSARDLLPRVRETLRGEGLWSEDLDGERTGWMLSLIELMTPHAQTLRDFASHCRPFLSDRFEIDGAAVRKHFKKGDARSRLSALAETLERAEAWEAAPLEEALRGLASSMGIGAAKLIHPARVALTGRAVSPGIFDVMVVIGRERTLARLRRMAAEGIPSSIP